MKQSITLGFLLACLFALPIAGICQYPVQVQIIVPQPVPTTVPELLGRTGEVVLILTNTSSTDPIDVMFSATTTGDNGFKGVVDSRNKKPAYPVTLPPGEPIMLTGDEIIDIFSNYTIFDIDYEGFELTDLALNPNFPEGTYTICIEVYKFGGNTPISAPAPMNCSAPIVVRTPDPPIITFPQEKDLVPYGPFTPIAFRWTNVTHPGSFFLYNFRLAECPPGVNPYDAIESKNFIVYEEADIPANLLMYDLTKPPLTGDGYAIQVQAYDPTGQVKVKNEGKSDVIYFEIKENVPQPPRLLKPAQSEEWEDEESYTFQWTTIPAGSAPINYRLQVGIYKEEVANSYEEVFENPDLILLDKEGIDGNSFQYDIPPLHDLSPYATYVARVQAYDKTGTVTIENDGWSDIHDFIILPPAGQEPNNFACGEGCTTSQPTGLAVNSFRNGQEVSMGNFTLKLKNVSVSGNTYNGTAEILPGNFFDSPVDVTLINAQFNNRGKAIAGKAQASMTANGAFPSNWTTPTGNMSPPSNPGTTFNYLVNSAYTLGSGNTSPQALPLRFGNIFITAMDLTPTTAKANLASVRELRFFSTVNGHLSFGKKDICISPGGPAISSAEAQLPLLQNSHVTMDDNISLYFQRSVNGAPNNGTVLPYNCDGHLPIAAVGYALFNDPEIKVKVNSYYSSGRRIYGQFATELSDWNNWTADMKLFKNAPTSFGSGQAITFRLNDLKQFDFTSATATLDHSTAINAPGFFINQGSSTGSDPFSIGPGTGQFGQQAITGIWRGIVFQDATVAIPAHFKGDSGERIVTDFPNLHFNGSGLGGSLEKTFAPDPSGTVGLWNMDFAELNIEIVENDLEEASFTGRLEIPFFRDWFPYTANYSPGNEVPNFSLDLEEDNHIPIWKTDVQFKENALLYTFPVLANDQLYLITNFGGYLTFDDRVDDVRGLLLRNIEFSSMAIYNHPTSPFGDPVKPMYISSFEIPYTSQKIAGYFISLKSIALKELWNRNMQLKLNYDVTFDNMSTGINSTTNFIVNAHKSGQGWERNASYISNIYLDEELPGLDIKGWIRYQNRSNGYDFRGDLEADLFTNFATIDIAGTFGTIGSRKYWSILATAEPGAPVPIFTGINMKAFGGGAYYNMIKESSGTSGSFNDISFRPKTSGTRTFGILANTLLQSTDPSEFNGRFLLEVDLKDWSLSDIRLSGYAHFFDEVRSTNHWLTNAEPAGNAQIKLDGEVQLKWTGNKFFSANLGYDINLKPNSVIRGSHSNALNLYFSSSRWHIKLGQPSDPLPLTYSPSMRVNGRNYSLGSVNTHSYFMVGSFGNAQAGLEIDYSKTWYWTYELGFANRFKASVDFNFDMDGAIGYGLTNCSNHDPDDFFAILSGSIELAGSASYYDRCDSWNPLDWTSSCNVWRGLGGTFGLSGSLYTPDPTGLTGDLEIGFTYGGETYGIELPFRLGSRCE